MRFNRFLHLIAFAGKAHRGSPASGGLTTKMPDGGAPSQAMSQPDFSPYLPLSALRGGKTGRTALPSQDGRYSASQNHRAANRFQAETLILGQAASHYNCYSTWKLC